MRVGVGQLQLCAVCVAPDALCVVPDRARARARTFFLNTCVCVHLYMLLVV